MSTLEIINTPAACIKCGFITNSPTTGKTQDKCPCCGGQLITVSKLTPNENVIVLAKRAAWDCSNDEGEWYGRKTTEEQIIKHFAPIGAELATLRAKLATAEQKVERLEREAMDNSEDWAMCGLNPEAAQTQLIALRQNHRNLQDAHAALQEQHKRAVELLREAQDFETYVQKFGDYRKAYRAHLAATKETSP